VSETIDKVKQKQGIISKIQDIFTLGYSTKEDLRELDKKLRDNFYADFKTLRHKWEEIYLEALNAKQPNGDDYKKVIQVMDRVAEKVNRADYGYAGLMDRKGHIRENELAKVFDYDKALCASIQSLEQAIEDLYRYAEAENWKDTPEKVREIKGQLLDLELKWDGREREFRPLEA
jgi:NAD-dependent DNA ligase